MRIVGVLQFNINATHFKMNVHYRSICGMNHLASTDRAKRHGNAYRALRNYCMAFLSLMTALRLYQKCLTLNKYIGYTHTHTHTHTHTRTYTPTHMLTHSCPHTHSHTQTHTCSHTQAQTYATHLVQDIHIKMHAFHTTNPNTTPLK
ncbi:hypothetical protein EMCRGX_G017976 [Ephydatia muelleri]